MFSSKPIKIPGPDHPITITPTKGQITVVVAGKRVADTREALTLKEAAYPAVQYIPRKDIDQTQLQRTSHQTYCPYKGECAYYSIPRPLMSPYWQSGWVPAQVTSTRART